MSKRLFLAIELPGEMREMFYGWQANYKHLSNIKWVPKENLHITAAFLGDIEERRNNDLNNDLNHYLSGCQKFILRFKEVILAPPRGKPRMIWVDFCDCIEFGRLVEKIWQAAEQYVGQEVLGRRKKSLPHVTLARLRQPIYFSGLKQPKLVEKSFEVDKIYLMESELQPGAPRYMAIKKIKLANKIC